MPAKKKNLSLRSYEAPGHFYKYDLIRQVGESGTNVRKDNQCYLILDRASGELLRMVESPLITQKEFYAMQRKLFPRMVDQISPAERRGFFQDHPFNFALFCNDEQLHAHLYGGGGDQLLLPVKRYCMHLGMSVKVDTYETGKELIDTVDDAMGWPAYYAEVLRDTVYLYYGAPGPVHRKDIFHFAKILREKVPGFKNYLSDLWHFPLPYSAHATTIHDLVRKETGA
jgi:hypothetical protein